MKPWIDRSGLKNATIKVGRNHKWSVDFRGEPPPEVTWIWRDDVPITNSDRITVTNTEYHTDYSVTKATRKDSGMYKLRIHNKNGQDEAEVELTVLGRCSYRQS